MKTIKGYKFIREDMKSKMGNHKWVVGKWYKEEKISLCNKGFHACKEPLEALNYIYGNKFFIIEAKGKIIYKKGDKFVAQEMRLIKEIPIKILKYFAIDCAKQCLKNYEKEFDDKSVYEVIEGAELYLDGKISLYKLKKRIIAAENVKSAQYAAKSAVWSAKSAVWSAEYAVWSAQYAAKSAVWSAQYAVKSAEYAVKSAACSAEDAAVKSAVWSAVKKKQNKKLKNLIKNEND